MMKRLLLITMLAACGMGVRAQDTYRTFVEDGKAWVGKPYSNPVNGEESYLYFQGDTTVAGLSAKQLFLREDGRTHYICAMYEEGRKVYAAVDGAAEFRLVYDFSLQTPGESITIDYRKLVLEKVDTITVNGQSFRRLHFNNSGSSTGASVVWVEGIGGTTIRYQLGYAEYGMEFLGCLVDGKEIFAEADFERTPTNTRSYQPLLADGKSWHYHYSDLTNPSNDYDYRYFIDGDTIVYGLKRYRLFSENVKNSGETRFEVALFEAGGCVFYYDAFEHEDYALYDFSPYSHGWWNMMFARFKVSARESRTVGGVLRDFIGFSRDGGDDIVGYWVEGIGSSTDLLKPLAFTPRSGHRLVSCEQDGKVLFEHADFGMPDDSYDELVPLVSYEPMFKVGKWWMYLHTFVVDTGGEPAVTASRVNLVVVGDTIINGSQCWQMNWVERTKSEPYALWMEEDRKVYKRVGDAWEMLFDFSPVKYAPFVTYGNDHYLDSIDLVTSCGRTYNRYRYISTQDSVSTPMCVEGVGTQNGIANVERLAAGFNTLTLVGVYEDDECVFIPEDFFKENVANGIEQIVGRESMTARGDGAIYDLQGRRVSEKGKVNSEQLPRGVYIQNGRKFVIK